MFKKQSFIFVAVLSLTLLFAVSCEKKSPLSPTGSSSGFDADSDAAESIASATGENTGGLMDGVGDVADLSSGSSFQGLGKADAMGLAKAGENAGASYDSTTGLWTITFTRENGSPSGVRYAYISRTVTVRFLNQDGQFQRRFALDGDTAATIEFNIVSGSGRHKTQKLSQRLNSLVAGFVATGTNTNFITVNGTYQRAATDTITTPRATRTLDYGLNLNLVNLHGPRGDRKHLLETVSGTVTGTFAGHVTFERGETYNEKDISRELSVTLSDSPILKIRGRMFKFNLKAGEITD